MVTGKLDVREAAARLPDEPKEEDIELLEEVSGEENERSEFDGMADSGAIG